MLILIIDDDPITLHALRFETERAGHLAVTVPDAYEGLRVIELRHFDMILCDVLLPQISGLVFGNLLKQFSNRSIPLLLMSSAAGMKRLVRQQDFGALGFLSKPVKRHHFNNWLNRIELLGKRDAC